MEVHPLGDELALRDLVRRRVHVLNATAACVWQHLDGETDLEGIGEIYRRQFTACTADEAMKDVVETVARFSREALLAAPLAGGGPVAARRDDDT